MLKVEFVKYTNAHVALEVISIKFGLFFEIRNWLKLLFESILLQNFYRYKNCTKLSSSYEICGCGSKQRFRDVCERLHIS